MDKDECVKILQEITEKKHVFFSRRGNSSIEISMQIVKELGREMVLLQDQGGWLTYEKFAEKKGMKCMNLKTRYGIISISDLEMYPDSVLLVNSMPGYSFIEDMRTVDLACYHHNIMVINDATASIGTKEAKVGDIVFGSFGKWKPINLGEGAFIATDDARMASMISASIAFNPDSEFFKNLKEKLLGLDARLEFLTRKRRKIIQKLCEQNFDVVMPDSEGLNIIVKDNSDEDERKRIIDFCKTNDLEYTECPRYIRVNRSGISIEIKRLEE